MRSAKLVVTLGGETRYIPVLASLSIGRDPKNDLVVSGRDIGALHCTIAWEGDTLVLSPAGAGSKVQVNGAPITGDKVLNDHDVIAVGRASLNVRIWRTKREQDSNTSRLAGEAPPKVAPHRVEVVDEHASTGRAFRDAVHIADASVLLVVGEIDRGAMNEEVVSMLRNAVRSRAKRDQGPAEVLRTINREFHARRMTGTAVALKVVFKNRMMTCASAGHPPPLISRTSGVEMVILPSTMGLGVLPNADFKTASMQAEPGDVVLLATPTLVSALGATHIPRRTAAELATALASYSLPGVALALQL